MSRLIVLLILFCVSFTYSTDLYNLGRCDSVHDGPGCRDICVTQCVCSQNALCCDKNNGWTSECVSYSESCSNRCNNDQCGSEAVSTDLYSVGSFYFSNKEASTDGPIESKCNNKRLYNDLWFCYVPSCLGATEITINTTFKAAITSYRSTGFCRCPTSSNQATTCSYTQTDNSIVAFHSFLGDSILLRIGGITESDKGEGNLVIKDNCKTYQNIINTITNVPNFVNTTDTEYATASTASWTTSQLVVLILMLIAIVIFVFITSYLVLYMKRLERMKSRSVRGYRRSNL